MTNWKFGSLSVRRHPMAISKSVTTINRTSPGMSMRFPKGATHGVEEETYTVRIYFPAANSSDADTFYQYATSQKGMILYIDGTTAIDGYYAVRRVSREYEPAFDLIIEVSLAKQGSYDSHAEYMRSSPQSPAIFVLDPMESLTGWSATNPGTGDDAPNVVDDHCSESGGSHSLNFTVVGSLAVGSFMTETKTIESFKIKELVDSHELCIYVKINPTIRNLLEGTDAISIGLLTSADSLIIENYWDVKDFGSDWFLLSRPLNECVYTKKGMGDIEISKVRIRIFPTGDPTEAIGKNLVLFDYVHLRAIEQNNRYQLQLKPVHGLSIVRHTEDFDNYVDQFVLFETDSAVVWVTSGAATNDTIDTSTYKTKSGSVNFDSSGTGTQALLKYNHTPFGNADLSDYKYNGKFEFWATKSDGGAMMDRWKIIMRTDASNYMTWTMTETASDTTWSLYTANLEDGVETGTFDWEDIDDFYIVAESDSSNSYEDARFDAVRLFTRRGMWHGEWQTRSNGAWTIGHDDSASPYPDDGYWAYQTDAATDDNILIHNTDGLRNGDLVVHLFFTQAHGTAGIVFRYQDPQNYWYACIDRYFSRVMVYKVVAGTKTQLVQKEPWTSFATDTLYGLKVELRDDEISVYLQYSEDSTDPWTYIESVVVHGSENLCGQYGLYSGISPVAGTAGSTGFGSFTVKALLENSCYLPMGAEKVIQTDFRTIRTAGTNVKRIGRQSSRVLMKNRVTDYDDKSIDDSGFGNDMELYEDATDWTWLTANPVKFLGRESWGSLTNTGKYYMRTYAQRMFASQTFTIGCWYYASSYTTTSRIIGLYRLENDDSIVDNVAGFRVDNTSGEIEGWYTTDGTTEQTIITTSVIADSSWKFLSMTYDGTTLSLYVDGVLVGSATVTLHAPTRTSYNLGAVDPVDIGQYVIGGFYYWNVCLTAAQLLAFYNEYDDTNNEFDGEYDVDNQETNRFITHLKSKNVLFKVKEDCL